MELVPLVPPGEGGGGGKRDGSGSPEPGTGDRTGTSPGDSGSSDTPSSPDNSKSATDGAAPGRTESGSGSGSAGPPEGSEASESASGSPSTPGGSGAGTKPSGPAKLSVGEPQRKPADDRWCEKVTVSFSNTGGSPVRSGTVTFETHVIGALGVDWATLESTEKLPAPIEAGKTVKKTWPVCVDAWRVPMGMHVETQDVSVKWE
ncbi:hypothetical protein ACWGII_20325 [Streptomyces sp. NPDC054855]